jgi:hypothetical protein
LSGAVLCARETALLELLLGITIGLLLLCVAMLSWIARRGGHDALLRVTARLEALRESQERITRAVVDEIGFGRREAAQASEQQRGELERAVRELRETLLEGLASDADLRKRQLGELGERVDGAGRRAASESDALLGIHAELRDARQKSAALLVESRSELRAALHELREESAAVLAELRGQLSDLDQTLGSWLQDADRKLAHAGAQSALDVQRFQERWSSALATLQGSLDQGWRELGESQARERGALTSVVESALGSLQDEHARRLERIRHAVEEQLPATLEQRLGDAVRFEIGRLDEIRRALDELRALAARGLPS